jgi:hypothetical protein
LSRISGTHDSVPDAKNKPIPSLYPGKEPERPRNMCLCSGVFDMKYTSGVGVVVGAVQVFNMVLELKLKQHRMRSALVATRTWHADASTHGGDEDHEELRPRVAVA